MSAGVALSLQATSELDERRLRVVAQQAVGLRWQIVLTAAIVAAIVWRAVPLPAVLGWFAAVIASREWRAVALPRLAADRSRPIAARLRATLHWNLLIGACNGSAALFMAWLDPTLDAVLTMILVCWAAGAVSTSATVMPAFLAYASLLFVPTAAMWFGTGTWLGAGIGALVLMFFGVQTRFARRNLQTFEESFGIRVENEALARTLQSERAQLASARDEAVRANHDKSRFLAGASHDLRQPLQAMALNIGALRHMPMDARARAIVEVVDASLEQLRSMLDALLDISKIDAGVVVARPQRVRLDRLAAAVAASFGAAAAARQIRLDTACPPDLAVHTDPDLLRRLLANLVDNAIKFTPMGGEVALQVVAHDEEVALTVRDSGPGIAPEHHRIVFEDLVRLRTAGAPPSSGHGLGLGIVRRMAELLRVEVELESSTGAGASFRLRLPRPTRDEADAEQAHAAGSLAGRRVLVLEDDPMVRGAYLNALDAMGCRVLSAGTLDEALAHLAHDRPDAAVVDCHLADGASGFDAVARLRAAHAGLTAVMVTADSGQAVVDAAHAQQVPLLRKPVDERSLAGAIAAAMAAAAARAPDPARHETPAPTFTGNGS